MSRLELARWQFDMTWALLELHLTELDTADIWWQPATHTWTLHREGDSWVPDFAETEPDPIPAPTIAWFSWHIGWWWSTTIDHIRGQQPREVRWPGDAAMPEWLRGLRTEWLACLDGLTESDLDRPASFPWQGDDDKTLAHTVAWVNAELMKNTAEIGQLRVLRAASP